LGQITADICQAPTTNLTQHIPYGPDDHIKTIDYHHLGMSRDDGMDEHGYGWLYGCHLVGFWPRSWEKSQLIFVKPPTTNLTQRNPYGTDDHIKTIDYHHMGMSRDDGNKSMDMVGSMDVIWFGFWPRSWDKSQLLSVKHRPQI
jgi:hypothetical protein